MDIAAPVRNKIGNFLLKDNDYRRFQYEETIKIKQKKGKVTDEDIEKIQQFMNYDPVLLQIQMAEEE